MSCDCMLMGTEACYACSSGYGHIPKNAIIKRIKENYRLNPASRKQNTAENARLAISQLNPLFPGMDGETT